MISDFGMTLTPILSVNPMGRDLLLGISEAEIEPIAETAHETIAGAVVALYRHCAGGRSASRRLAKLRGAHRR